ncbi:Histidine kinase-, DNA gyrase B-, and HSP90-like ATPase [Chryseolinea serpens]|uniref:histidine kinase n=1 Tax=Chryseolinea serpens TaxID=947013 RepID=A0A1M5JWJ5_9BACT|nr:sensor histidine kinase [Chryseolinea serpens]SHG44924.1 Histidine kinase-, DNA gyrase B-, and HSP90-like ATPase [Chryseolinea serpens]
MDRRAGWIALLVFSGLTIARGNDLEPYFSALKQLKFNEAKHVALLEEDSALRIEMIQLADLLFYAGQRDKKYFVPSESAPSGVNKERILIFRNLNRGYYSLFYDQLKGNAYKSFYEANHQAQKLDDSALVKASVYAFLKYYGFEIAQNSNSCLVYVKSLERLRSDRIDDLWLTLYRMIFYSKSINGLDRAYFTLNLDQYESSVDKDSPLLACLFYEKALKFYLSNDLDNAKSYYQKTVTQSAQHPFLNTERFLSLMKLMQIAIKQGNLQDARNYLNQASLEVNQADTLRSNYYMNINGSLLLHAESKNDSAYRLLKKAYEQDFQLDFRRNTLDINRLTVELETQEKENANLKLRESRTTLIFALGGAVILCLMSYLAYTNQKSKNKVQRKEKEVQAMKLAKVLKDQELFGIDAMIEGQEKERQRIANDLHDNLGSLLATVKLHFQSLKTKKDRLEPDQDHLLQKTNELIDEAYQKVRAMAHSKNVGVNAQEGLLPAVKTFAAKISISNELVIEVEEHGMEGRLESSLEITMFRIIQELVTNIIKHAQATEAIIHLTQHEDLINIMVEDNGIGFDIGLIKPGESMGLYSIQRRIENLGGQVTIDSIAEKGTAVIIDVPLTT